MADTPDPNPLMPIAFFPGNTVGYPALNYYNDIIGLLATYVMKSISLVYSSSTKSCLSHKTHKNKNKNLSTDDRTFVQTQVIEIKCPGKGAFLLNPCV